MQISLTLTPEEFRFLLDVIEADAEERSEYHRKAVNAGYNPNINTVAARVYEAANNAYHDWEENQG